MKLSETGVRDSENKLPKQFCLNLSLYNIISYIEGKETVNIREIGYITFCVAVIRITDIKHSLMPLECG
jgi:hypothetical protein